MKRNSMDRPVITSGMTNGAETSPEKRVRPGNRRNRASAKPAMVPSRVAKVALTAAMRILSNAASIIWVLAKSLTYHSVENPPHKVTSLDLLKE
jgi:hypothetical protein